MSIIYVSVIKGNTIVASFSSSNADFERDISKLLSSSQGRTEQVISSENVFTFIVTSALSFVCVTKTSTDRKLPFAYLDILSKRWAATVGAIPQNAKPHQYDQAFRC